MKQREGFLWPIAPCQGLWQYCLPLTYSHTFILNIYFIISCYSIIHYIYSIIFQATRKYDEMPLVSHICKKNSKIKDNAHLRLQLHVCNLCLSLYLWLSLTISGALSLGLSGSLWFPLSVSLSRPLCMDLQKLVLHSKTKLQSHTFLVL